MKIHVVRKQYTDRNGWFSGSGHFLSAWFNEETAKSERERLGRGALFFHYVESYNVSDSPELTA